MHPIKTTKFLCILILAAQAAWAQQAVLDQYLAEGLASNEALKQENFAFLQGLSALREAKGLFLPQVSFRANYTRARGGRAIDFPVGDLLNPVYSTLNQLTEAGQFPQVSNVNEQFLPDNFHETHFRVIQPLFDPDIFYNYQINRERLAAQGQKKEAFRQELVKEIKTAYFQYIQSEEAKAIYQETRVLLEEVLRVNMRLVENQKATKEVVYGAEYEISKIDQQITEAEKDVQVSRAYFNFLLNKELDASIEKDSTLKAAMPSEGLVQAAQLAEGEQTALQNRHEVRQLQYGLNAQHQDLKRQKAGAFPRVNLVGDIGYQGFGYNFGPDQDFWLVQVSLQWDLFKGFQNKGRIEQARLENLTLQSQMTDLKKNIRLQVKQAHYAWKAAQEGKVAADKALQQVDAQFKIAQRKYEEGMLSFYELLQVRTNLTEARLSNSIAKYQFFAQEAHLEWAMGLTQ